MIDQMITELLLGARSPSEWLDLEDVPSVLMPDGGGADTGGRNPLAHGTSTWTPGALFTFQPKVRAKSLPWDNVYRYHTLSRDRTPAIYFAHQFQFAYPSAADISASTAFEIEMELCESGLAYDMGWQYKPSLVDGPPSWRWFDETARSWNTVEGLPRPAPIANKLISVFALFSVNRVARTTTHEAIVIDGTSYQVGATHRALQKWPSTVNYLHNAAQLDSDGKGTPCSIQLRHWNARAL